jgi:hypothetical protein
MLMSWLLAAQVWVFGSAVVVHLHSWHGVLQHS